MLRRQVRQATGKPRGHRSPRKIDVTRKLTVVSVSVVTLIRTDTTLIIAKRPRRYEQPNTPEAGMVTSDDRDGCDPTGKQFAFPRRCTHNGCAVLVEELLRVARSRRPPLKEIVPWTTTSLHPSESQTSECSDLLSRSRATCLIVAQR